MDKFFRILSASTAVAGGVVLIALVILTCTSVIGRSLISFGLGPISGDFEYVEMGVAFAIFCFLPWCHYNKAHASVELFTQYFNPSVNRFIDVLSDALMLAASVLISWRLFIGAMDKKSYFETTFILQVPIWWAYAACVVGASIFTLVCAYCLVRSVRALSGAHHD